MSRSAQELVVAAQAWIEGDPDPQTQAELTALLAAGDFAVLAERLEPLSFGTAGLRAAVGAGSGRMNLAVVTRAAFGIARYVLEELASSAPIVIGFDARPTSRAFAEASAGVLLAAGLRVVAFSSPAATPLCAFLGRELGAAVSIVVTASHNPRADNGYKVYGANAVQIISPVDALISRHIAAAPSARLVPRQNISFESAASPALTLLEPEKLAAYFQAVSSAFPGASSARALSIVHSALHGVGSVPMLRTLADAGFCEVHVVPAQAAPDGSFPTTPFPNPEEPGSLDLALAEAESRQAQLLLVSDPDADRLAAAARLDGVMTVLDGNQVGALLADYVLSLCPASPTPLVLSSIVSSPLVGLIATARGAHHERTHTGFKWLWHAALALERRGVGRFAFAYEEALGYSVFSAVRDKDGIAAGRALAELAAGLAAQHKTLFDRLFELYAEHGLWVSAARNVHLEAPEADRRIGERLDALAQQHDLGIGDQTVISAVDYRAGGAKREPWLAAATLLELELADQSRLFVRPSGTEPKLKLYAHVRRNITRRSDFATDIADARRFAATLLEALEAVLQL